MLKSGLLFMLMLFIGASYAEVPLSQMEGLQPLTDAAILQLPEIDIAKENAPQLRLVSSSGKHIPRPYKIAEVTTIGKTIDELGQWQSLNGEHIWRLRIKGAKVFHLNLGFRNFYLPESARLFISNSKTGEVLEQYSSLDNKDHGQLWTPIFNTNDIQIEINLATTEKQQLKLQLVQAGQGTTPLGEGFNTKSGSCNIDVACPEGDEWRDEIRAVAKFSISDTSGTYVCTGTLVNNSRGDLVPLFLTAAHCLVSDITAATMVFYWNYETSVCGGTPDGDLSQYQNGARLISRWDDLASGSDFALVQLDVVPDGRFDVYYAGWDNSDQTYTGAISIHHPDGAVNSGNSEKRISIDDDPLTITAFDNTVVDPAASYLRIGQWESGTTEGGSSGAGLWNMNHHLIGTLSGGAASCSSPTESDWYGRMASHWLGNGYNSNQLAPYLAPDNNLVTTVDGRDNCESPSVSIDVSNANPLISEQISFTSTVTGGAGNYSYEWDFDDDGNIDSTDDNPIYTYTAAANNTVTLIVRDSVQCPAVVNTRVLVADSSEQFLADGMLVDGFVKTGTAEGSWVVDDGESSEGLFSLKTETINGGNASSIELTGIYDSGTLSFDRRVSSEADNDFFKFFIDDIEQFSISGEQDWDNVSYSLSEGSHTFRWSFEKDEALSGGKDAAWIDNVVFTADLPPAPSKSSGGSVEYFLLGFLLMITRLKKAMHGQN